MCDKLDENLAPSVVKDMLGQLNGLSKRHLDIKLMVDTEPNISPIPYTEADPVDGSLRTTNLPVGQFTSRIKRRLLELKDQVQDRRREEENRAKIFLTEGLKLGPGRLKLRDLENRSVVLPY